MLAAGGAGGTDMLARVLRVARGSFVIAALAACILAAPAGAQTKPYKVVVAAPTDPVPGGPAVKFTVTITNRTGTQRLGSADLTAPANFRVVSASSSRGTATPVGNNVQLRDLGLQPDEAVAVTVTATVPCVAGA